MLRRGAARIDHAERRWRRAPASAAPISHGQWRCPAKGPCSSGSAARAGQQFGADFGPSGSTEATVEAELVGEQFARTWHPRWLSRSSRNSMRRRGIRCRPLARRLQECSAAKRNVPPSSVVSSRGVKSTMSKRPSASPNSGISTVTLGAAASTTNVRVTSGSPKRGSAGGTATQLAVNRARRWFPQTAARPQPPTARLPAGVRGLYGAGGELACEAGDDGSKDRRGCADVRDSVWAVRTGFAVTDAGSPFAHAEEAAAADRPRIGRHRWSPSRCRWRTQARAGQVAAERCSATSPQGVAERGRAGVHQPAGARFGVLHASPARCWLDRAPRAGSVHPHGHHVVLAVGVGEGMLQIVVGR